jgi:hypothetical protein
MRVRHLDVSLKDGHFLNANRLSDCLMGGCLLDVSAVDDFHLGDVLERPDVAGCFLKLQDVNLLDGERLMGGFPLDVCV